MTHAEFELYRPTYTPKIKASLIAATEAIGKADFIILVTAQLANGEEESVFSGQQCVWMSQTNVDETAERGQLWIRRVSGRKNKSMWDEEKTVFAPERNIFYFSLPPCVDKSREDK